MKLMSALLSKSRRKKLEKIEAWRSSKRDSRLQSLQRPDRENKKENYEASQLIIFLFLLHLISFSLSLNCTRATLAWLATKVWPNGQLLLSKKRANLRFPKVILSKEDRMTAAIMSHFYWMLIFLIQMTMMIATYAQSRCDANIGGCDPSDDNVCCSPNCVPYLYRTCNSCQGTVCRCQNGYCVAVQEAHETRQHNMKEPTQKVEAVVWPDVLIIIAIGIIVFGFAINLLWCFFSMISSKAKRHLNALTWSPKGLTYRRSDKNVPENDKTMQ